MTNNESEKICLDKVLDQDLIIPAAETAISENSTNTPNLRFTPGIGITGPSPLELAALTSKKWKQNRVLRVHFLDGDKEVIKKVKEFAKQWEKHQNIKFQFVEDPSAEIRISFKEEGSWSYLGTDALSITNKNKPTMNFGWLTKDSEDNEYSRVVIHEFGHALGCIHEHQNPATNIPWNKEKVYELYKRTNGWDKAQVDNNLFKKYSESITQFSEFDKQSIMLYSIPNSLTTGDFEVGWNRKLSNTDKNFISKIYPKKISEFVELKIGSPPTKEKIGEHGEEDVFTFKVGQPGSYIIETGGWTDVIMSLYGPGDQTNRIAFDDDAGFLWNARIDTNLESGTYFIRVSHYRPKGKGNYEISVAFGD